MLVDNSRCMAGLGGLGKGLSSSWGRIGKDRVRWLALSGGIRVGNVWVGGWGVRRYRAIINI